LNDFDPREIVHGLIFLAILGMIINFAEAIGWKAFGFGIFGLIGFFWLRSKTKPLRDQKKLKKETKALQKLAAKLTPPFETIRSQLQEAGIGSDFLLGIAAELFEEEGYSPPSAEPLDVISIDHGRYRDKLKKYNDAIAVEGRCETFTQDVISILSPFVSASGGIFSTYAPLDAYEANQIAVDVDTANEANRSFASIKRVIDRNYKQQGCSPSKYRGDDNVVWAYLKGTPFSKIRHRVVGVDLHNRTRHTMILGGSGSGKTNLIEYLIRCDLEEIYDDDNDDPAHIVVIDSQRQLIPKLATLPLPDKMMTYLNPEWDMGLNLFDVGWDGLSKRKKEEVVNSTVGLILFVLQGTLSTKMSDRQEVVFRYTSQLVITIPDGNLMTLYNILEEGGLDQYRDYIKEVTNAGQDFFNKEWNIPVYKQTREALRSRLHILLNNPTFERLFSATENRFNMFDELQDRALILLDTHKPALQDGSSFLGRLYIAMIVLSARQRFENRDADYGRVYLYIDEAHEYFDESITEMFEQARKANIGVIISHQDLTQVKKRPGLEPATVLGCTATKLVATSLADDAATMAKAMRVTADRILDLPDFTFGLYDKGQGFVEVSAPANPLEALLDQKNQKDLQKVMEDRYGMNSNPKPSPENRRDKPSEAGDSGLGKQEPI